MGKASGLISRGGNEASMVWTVGETERTLDNKEIDRQITSSRQRKRKKKFDTLYLMDIG